MSRESLLCTRQWLLRECQVGSLAHYVGTLHLCPSSIQAPLPPAELGSPAQDALSPQSLPATLHPETFGCSPCFPALCRRAAVLRAAPSLRLPHPHGQLHRQPGPAAEDALQQVRRRWAPRLGSQEPEGTGTSDAGRPGLREANDSLSHPAT